MDDSDLQKTNTTAPKISVGLTRWITNAKLGVVTTPGTVMISALSTILGTQLLIGFLSYDMADVPHTPIWPRLKFHSQLKTRLPQPDNRFTKPTSIES